MGGVYFVGMTHTPHPFYSTLTPGWSPCPRRWPVARPGTSVGWLVGFRVERVEGRSRSCWRVRADTAEAVAGAGGGVAVDLGAGAVIHLLPPFLLRFAPRSIP